MTTENTGNDIVVYISKAAGSPESDTRLDSDSSAATLLKHNQLNQSQKFIRDNLTQEDCVAENSTAESYTLAVSVLLSTGTERGSRTRMTVPESEVLSTTTSPP